MSKRIYFSAVLLTVSLMGIVLNAVAAPGNQRSVPALISRSPKELSEMFVSGDLVSAQAAANALVHDWESCRANYDLLIDAMKKTMDKPENFSEIPEIPGDSFDAMKTTILKPGPGETPVVRKELPRSVLILERLPDIIREAPLGPERDSVMGRFVTFLENEMEHPSPGLPRYRILQNIHQTVYSRVPFVAPEREGGRVLKHLFAGVDDVDIRVRLTARNLLRWVSYSQNTGKRLEYLEILKTRRNKEATAQGLTPEERATAMKGLDGEIDNIQWLIDSHSEVLGEREYRAIAEDSTDGLLARFVGHSSLQSQCALDILATREDTLDRVLDAAEPKTRLWTNAVLRYAVAIPSAGSTASARQRIDDLVAHLKTVLEAPYITEQKGRPVAAVKALGRLLDKSAYAREFAMRNELIPTPYAEEQVVNLLIGALSHPDVYTRQDAVHWLKSAVQDNPETAVRILPELEKRMNELAQKNGYGKESIDKVRDRLMKESGHYPEEWKLYEAIAEALDRAQRSVKPAKEDK